MIELLMIAALAGAPDATKPPPPPVRCKRIQETGSFVKTHKVCHTEAEWRALQANTDRELDAMNEAARINATRPPK